MKTLIGILLFVEIGLAAEAPRITIADSINPGSADYIISNITAAEAKNAPYIVIEMDTPGGLLSSTRSIVQKMLSASIPVVVFIGPKGAQAGSAGAIITFAADVAVMAPGTNIGAAHPVVPGGKDETDANMDKKITNDTSAFAEGLAKGKGRNAEWAIKAVRDSASIIAEKAVELNVVDFIAGDITDLQNKLANYKLRVPKNKVTHLPKESVTLVLVPMTVKQKLVNFVSNPNIAYVIMSFAGLCLWVELSNPGLIFPGVVGGICIILSLISFQMLPISYGALAFILLGLALLIAETFIPAFGIVGISGIVCFILGSLFLMDTNVPEMQLSLAVIIPTVLVLGSFALIIAFSVAKTARRRVASGVETILGEVGEVREEVTDTSGLVFVQGELWLARLASGEPLAVGTRVRVEKLDHMILYVTKLNADQH